jgi:hypothetical protein
MPLVPRPIARLHDGNRTSSLRRSIEIITREKAKNMTVQLFVSLKQAASDMRR